MNKTKKMFSVFLCWVVLWSQTASINASQINAGNPPPPSLDEIIKLSSWEIREIAENNDFNKGEIQEKMKEIEKANKAEKEHTKKIQKDAEAKIKASEKKLKDIPQSVTDPKAVAARQDLKCGIVAIKDEAAPQIVASIEKRIAYDVSNSKLMLLKDWKSAAAEIDRKTKNGTISQRTLGDSKTQIGNVLDIGSRSSESPFSGQEQDIQLGADELRRLKMTGQFPKEVVDPVITEYVNRLAQNLARNSDLVVPLNVSVVSETEKRNGRTVLDKNGQERQVVNAFALPGGFLVVYAGLILESESESEFAGALAHEIAHGAARHGHRIMSRAAKFNLLETAIQMATLFIPMGYWLFTLVRYGFSGLDLYLNLNLLGVSRDFELEADQLGMQYVWHTGYDPSGFTTLFDRMAAESGYASHTSFFQTHPAFGDRILVASKEERALRSVDPNRTYATNTSEFNGIRERVRKLNEIISREEAKNPDEYQPSLFEKEQKEEEACKEILPAAPPLSSVRTVPDTDPITSIPEPNETAQPESEPDEYDKPPVLKRAPQDKTSQEE
ncbi:MAG: M48 family metalloprotease [Candidatus Yanofskybacteria bacterium]|nr:M48 family metalloprotease [Candidatus Yanofskybacteria bacterium]